MNPVNLYRRNYSLEEIRRITKQDGWEPSDNLIVQRLCPNTSMVQNLNADSVAILREIKRLFRLGVDVEDIVEELAPIESRAAAFRRFENFVKKWHYTIRTRRRKDKTEVK